ncbi:50S ribosome-binding protein YggL [Hymenobacter lucidus]|uniref:YggL family protein n=1 Tax=Hymenobacter lucidus TaxID=2880930 RepID=A0ABS8ATG5_9BACT|nr:50S ribosome-binding protein YggL [Hymenobacter lucidus]MCB2409490.1 YggL family protein [Hymenobacter lucidus]
MKKRLRKKTYRKEFQEFSWNVSYRLNDDQPNNYLEFSDTLLEQVEDLDLIIGGTLNDFAATPVKRLAEAQAREKRDQLQQWLAARPEVAEATSSELTDAYYGPFRG